MRRFCWLITCLLVLGAPVGASPVPARPEGASLVPEDHLRAYDPVTVFFDQPQVAEAGPVIAPPENVAFAPAHPGAWRWLDRQTLQFQPADPWPPLARFDWRVQEQRYSLHSLMAAPVSTYPAAGSEGLAPIEALILRFRNPVDLTALREMLRLEVFDAPASGEEALRVVGHEGFSLQAMERSDPAQPASYRLRLKQPVAQGRELRLQLRLALDDAPGESFQTLRYRTREAFRPVYFGCAGQQRSISPEGSDYPRDDALRCDAGERVIEVGFSAEPAQPGPVLGRQLLRFEPHVANLRFEVLADRLRIRGDFASDAVYRMHVMPAHMQDVHGRALELSNASSLALYFPAPGDFLELNQGEGRVMMEARGPQMLPLRGRGDERLDLRIHAIDAEDLRFWPFIDRPVRVNDDARPPGPGEEPAPRRALRMSEHELAERVATLGSASIAEILPLPLADTTQTARFGLDLAPHLRRVSGAQQPGHYLVGVRRIGEDSQRQWVRLQVTDLSLSVVEDETSVRFVVTSLASGEPLAGAEVLVQAPPPRNSSDEGLIHTLASGRTDRDGAWQWQPTPNRYQPPPERLVVRYGKDRLLIDVSHDAPPQFHRGYLGPDDGWLRWTVSPQARRSRVEESQWHCHLFTERPVYRNEDVVHIGGFVRQVHRGDIRRVAGSVQLLIRGPDGSEWRQSMELDEAGGFYHRFDQPTPASGNYWIELSVGEEDKRQRCDSLGIEKTAYRIPRFEVEVDGPQRVGMDRAFEVDLSASYYAGGAVAGQGVNWRVTQFPYRWLPAGREGFAFSSDGRFSQMGDFDARGQLSQVGETDQQGQATLSIDPTLEPSAQPRRYVIEATVTGADDQTVTDTHQVMALPPFVLGLKAPRYLQQADELEAELVLVGPDDELLAGREMSLRLIRRRWAARLQAGDFSTGEPRYETEVVDETIAERSLTSAAEPLEVTLPLADTGVYILELSARDELGRTQTLTLDLFNDGEARATWPKPPAPTFEVSSEADAYAPGETARLILQSPLGQGRALAVIEQPNGENEYRWLAVEQGRAVLEVAIRREHLPSLPVHFLLMRGRLDNDQAPRVGEDGLDLGKPVTMAASHAIEVKDTAHRVAVSLHHPEKAQPGDSIEVTLRLSNQDGEPLAGFVSLWLVDQAVLALGEEQPLDMLADFIRQRPWRSALRDTRNRPVGYLPFLTEPGGDGARLERAMAADMANELLSNLTIRQRFESVPYFRHAIPVGKSGETTVSVTLPDDLTNFMLRAKAVSGADRFGHAAGQIAVRLPVIVQPSLPRFLRYGDQATLSATSRIVDGPAGSGQLAVRLEGLRSEAPLTQSFEWSDEGVRRLDLPVTVPVPERWPSQPDATPNARVTMGVQRQSDGVGDGFSVDVAVLPDRLPEHYRQRLSLSAGESATLLAPEQAPRPGTLRRSLLLSDQPATLLMAAGLNQLLHYPHFCTEQRISRARAMLAARGLLNLLDPDTASERLDHHVNATLAYLADAQNAQGMVGYWPGDATGNVAVTSWALHFVVEAREAGFAVDGDLHRGLHDALQRGLRGGHDAFFSRYLERTMALTALAADGALDSGYAAELARRSQFLGLEAIAHVTQALAMEADPGPDMLARLSKALWDGLVFELRDGKSVYAGLQAEESALSPMILPSETRTVARVLQAIQSLPESSADRRRQLVDVLVQLGRGDGWGSTNANAEAILALSSALEAGRTGAPAWRWNLGGESYSHEGEDGLVRRQLSGDQAIELSVAAQSPALGALHQWQYVPAPPGHQAAAQRKGLVVEREAVLIDPDAERQHPWEGSGQSLALQVGQIVEDRLSLISPSDRYHVAIEMPLAAGMELLNPSLQTAPPEATPSLSLTLPPSHVAWRDDAVVFYYDQLPAGQYRFAVRQRAQFPGVYTQPPARAQLMYKAEVNGRSVGGRITIERSDAP